MKVTEETLHKIAHLSRLEMNPDTQAAMLKSLNSVVEWVDMLNQVDTEGVKPLTYMSQESNITRADEALAPLSHDKGLLNAPSKDSDYFRVPKVME